MKTNFCLSTDCYKITHHLQYPQGTERIYSYLERMGGEFKETVFFGLQIILKKYFEGAVVQDWMLGEADDVCRKIFGAEYFNRKGWERILNVHGGRLPLIIKAVPEGTVVPTGNVLVTVENTDPELAFLTNFVETLLLEVWYPISVCTLSYQIKKLISKYCGFSDSVISPFHLNDFGFRGTSSKESAGIGGCAHLVNFLGTDTIEGIRYAMEYYKSDVCGHSVMASEHSTTTVYGKDNEKKAYETFLDKCSNGILSMVIDSYDTFHAVDVILGKDLKDKILKRDGKLVVRPDSGYPPDVTIEILTSLWNNFGGTITTNGFKRLNPKVGVIYGDGINYAMIEKILSAVVNFGFCVDNVVFGMGGQLLQGCNRDTHKFAFKCSATKVNGQWRDVYKEPKTDSGKNSKRGRLMLVKTETQYNTVPLQDNGSDLLQTVFKNGEIIKEYTFDEVRKAAL